MYILLYKYIRSYMITETKITARIAATNKYKYIRSYMITETLPCFLPIFLISYKYIRSYMITETFSIFCPPAVLFIQVYSILYDH